MKDLRRADGELITWPMFVRFLEEVPSETGETLMRYQVFVELYEELTSDLQEPAEAHVLEFVEQRLAMLQEDALPLLARFSIMSG